MAASFSDKTRPMHVRISWPTLSCRFLDNSMSAVAHSAGKSKPTSTTFSGDTGCKSGEATVEVSGLPGVRASKDMRFTFRIWRVRRGSSERTKRGVGTFTSRGESGPQACGSARGICLPPMESRSPQIAGQGGQKWRKMAINMIAITPATAAMMANWTSQRESSGKLARGMGAEASRLGEDRMMAGSGGSGA
jgi:hypothetical protein